jgi:hypothetical protein
MEVSTYNSCLLITLASSECFGMVEMQINDILGLSDDAFVWHSEELVQVERM